VRTRGVGPALLAGALALAACGGESEPVGPERDAAGRPLDPATGLVLAEDWELVATNCVQCHSARQFLRQRGTAAMWQRVIDWMQATQGLWELPDGQEERIVAYLAAHYGPGPATRRAPLPPDLLPPNPYRAENSAKGGPGSAR
jgi:hypothetical protein